MTTHSLALAGVSFTLPNGNTLFSGLTHSFESCPTGLVGRNGVGKSVLARLLAGQLKPSSGYIHADGRLHYLAQQVQVPAGSTVAGLAGVAGQLNALSRIESGSCETADFDALNDQWDIRQRFRDALERNQLGYLSANAPAERLSGGEAMRVTLLGAMLSQADWLILDEPTNHLDRPNRQALIGQLQRWPGGLLVISHDRSLLTGMQRIVELSSQGLRSYGGNYAFFAEARAQEGQAAERALAHQRLLRRREQLTMERQRQRQEKRQVRGHKRGLATNQPKMLLDKQKERSEHSAGALRQQHTARREMLDSQVESAAQRVSQQAEVSLHAVAVDAVPSRRVAQLRDVILPRIEGPCRRIDLCISGQQRLGVVGANGCGKSTLLQVLAGQVAPISGQRWVDSTTAYLDQSLATLAPAQPVLECLQHANPSASTGELCARLAHLGLDRTRIDTPSAWLSGGERLKSALACLLYAERPPALLLLDEPSNHLDLASTQALEVMLRGYPGALVVVSHDDAFLDQLALTDQLLASTDGWTIQPLDRQR